MAMKTTRRDMGADKIRAAIRKMNAHRGKPHVAVGIVGKVDRAEGDLTVAEVATFHEFGTETIPERSFLRSTFRIEREAAKQLTKQMHRDVIYGIKTVPEALAVLGQWFVAKVKNRIIEGIPPALQPGTIARKGSSKPLIDTGQMLNSISYEVRDGKEK